MNPEEEAVFEPLTARWPEWRRSHDQMLGESRRRLAAFLGQIACRDSNAEPDTPPDAGQVPR